MGRMNTNKIIKTRCFCLDPIPEQFDEIKSKLARFAGVENVKNKDNKLIVSYDLNLCHYKILKDFISELVTLKPETCIGKLQALLISYTEQNELDHTEYPSGLAYYVQNLYLSLHKNN